MVLALACLGINLKKNLHYFDKNALLAEINRVNEWYDEFEELHELALDYRITSVQSAGLRFSTMRIMIGDLIIGFISIFIRRTMIMKLGYSCEIYTNVLKSRQSKILRRR